MIIKRAPRESAKGSSYRKLADYICNPAKVTVLFAPNMPYVESLSDKALAIAGVEAVQAMNTRARSDRNYHLIVSFNKADRPINEEELRQIEARIVEAIGFGEHQRLVAMHDDKDHKHLHIAINKIHPTRYTLHEPYYDKKRLTEIGREIERDFGLIPLDRAQDRDHLSTGDKAQAIAEHRGQVSFQHWVRAEVAEELRVVVEMPGASWPQLHAILARSHLELVPRGSGFILRDRDDAALTMKASQVGRFLSGATLIKAFGAYQETPNRSDPSVRRYAAASLRVEIAGSTTAEKRQQLWTEYEQYRTAARERRRDGLGALEARREKAWQTHRASFADQREQIKASAASRAERRAAYSLLRMERLQAELRLRAEYRQARAAIVSDTRVSSWQDYLQQQAADGRPEALAVLRSLRRRDPAPASGLSGLDDGEALLAMDYAYRVHRNGDVTYRLASGQQIRDEARRITTGLDASDLTIELALRLAQARFLNQALRIEGDQSYKYRVAKVAAEAGLAVSFEDAAMEQERQHLVAARRSVAPRTETVKPTHAAVAAYVLEREQKRAGGMTDIPLHRMFADSDYRGAFQFAGLRTVQDISLVLLRDDAGSIAVMPLHDKDHERLKQARLGTPVKITPQGRIITVSRSRSPRERGGRDE